MTAADKGRYRAEVERLLHSEEIRHSTGLRKLLAYLAEKALDGGAADLKEYTIGIEAFGKPSDYDPQQDPTVRVLASKLRRKLEEYYLKEGQDSPVRVELPKGHYELKFGPNRPTGDGAALRAAAARARRWRFAAVVLGLTTVAAVAVSFRVSQSVGEAAMKAPPGAQLWSPELERIWEPFLTSSRPLVVSLGTPLFTKFADGFFRSPGVNEWAAAQQSPLVRSVQEALQSTYALPWHGFTGIGEAFGAFQLSRLLASRKPNMVLKRSAALGWEDIRDYDLIFLGSPKFNVHLERVPFPQEFVIKGGSVFNLHPRPGERKKYGDEWVTKNTLREDYALVSKFRGLHGRGQVLVLGSSSSPGTWAAVEYVTRPEYARELVGNVALPGGELPEAYQVLVKAEFQDNVPTRVSYVAHRVIGRPES